MKRTMPVAGALFLALGLGGGLGGCTYYEVAPGTYTRAPGAFDRSWSAAVGAMADEGVRITSQDAVAGRASGVRGDIDVTALVRTQSDGSVRVEFNTSGNTAADPTLIERITARYNQRMGR
jgi:hypothetical protein